jgi:hypothetical protein
LSNTGDINSSLEQDMIEKQKPNRASCCREREDPKVLESKTNKPGSRRERLKGEHANPILAKSLSNREGSRYARSEANVKNSKRANLTVNIDESTHAGLLIDRMEPKTA